MIILLLANKLRFNQIIVKLANYTFLSRDLCILKSSQYILNPECHIANTLFGPFAICRFRVSEFAACFIWICILKHFLKIKAPLWRRYSGTSLKGPPKCQAYVVAPGDNRLWELRPYHNCIDLTYVLNVLFMWKANFEKKPSSSLWEISISCTTQECDDVTTPYHPIYALLPAKWSLTGG